MARPISRLSEVVPKATEVAPFEAAETWPEFDGPVDRQIDDVLGETKGVEDLIARGEEGLRQSRRCSGSTRPACVRGMGPGRQLGTGKHRYLAGHWETWVPGKGWVAREPEMAGA